MVTIKYPHTMVKGRFKGQTFETLNDYQKAVRATNGIQTSKGTKSNTRRIINQYELLMASGIGRERSIQILEEFDK